MLSDSLPQRHGLITSKTPGKTGILEMSDEETAEAIKDPASYNEALSAEFTHGKVVQRARATLAAAGVYAPRVGAQK